MKKIILISIFLSLIFGFEIQKNKVFKIEFLPKEFNINITLIIIKKKLNILLKSISNLPKNNFCTINNYSITPIFNKDNHFEIYKSYINLNCSINNETLQKLDGFIQQLSSIGKVKINSIYPKIENHNNLLKLKAYSYGEKFSKELSKKLGYHCYVKSVIFNNTSSKRFSNYKSLSLPLPNNLKKEILNTLYIIECLK